MGRRPSGPVTIVVVLTLVVTWLVLSVLTAPLGIVLVRSGQLADRVSAAEQMPTDDLAWRRHAARRTG